MKEIEAFLRENRPVVPDDPTFLLEAQRRMEAVEGIKAEMDRQRRRGRSALVLALVIGLALGALLSAVAYFWPVDAAPGGWWDEALAFLRTWRACLVYPVAALAVSLSLMWARGRWKTSF